MKDLYDTGCMFRGGRIMVEVDRDEENDVPRHHTVREFSAWITDMMRAWNAELRIGETDEV